jgi:hypothetical protein
VLRRLTIESNRTKYFAPKKWILATIAVLFLISAALSFWWLRCQEVSRCFEQTTIGQDYHSVIACFGAPTGIHTVENNDGYFLQNAVRNTKDVRKVIVYTFFIVNTASIYFGPDDKVVGKYMYSSP